MSQETQTLSKNLDSYYRFAPDPDWAYLLTVEEALEKQSHNEAVIEEWPICRFAISSTIYLENDENVHYHHQVIDKYLTRKSLERLGEISLDFSINHQQILIHRLNVVRQGQIIDKLKTSHYFLNDTVRSNAEQLHGGNGQLNIVINDLQLGDVLDFSYTIAGASPSMRSCFNYGMELRTYSPLLYRRLAIIKPNNRAIFWKKFAGEVATFSSVLKTLPRYDCICFETFPEQIEMNNKDQDVPVFDQVGNELILTDQGSWADFVKKIIPYYHVSDDSLAFIHDYVAKNIDKAESLEHQILACVDYVQNQIRYLSLSEPLHSWHPYSLAETINNGFGDCKDKSLLLVAMMKALGVEAYCVLINATDPAYPMQALPGRVFDHVVVLIRYQGDNYWIDPTSEFEAGAFSVRGSTVKGYGLILSPETTDLCLIQPNHINNSLVYEHYDFSNAVTQVAKLSCQTIFYGDDASRLRKYIADVGMEGYKQSRLQAHQERFAEIIQTGFNVTDNTDKNSIQVEETYKIENIHQHFNQEGVFYLLAKGIVCGIQVPSELEERYQALQLPWGFKITHEIRVTYPRQIRLPDESPELVLNNQYVDYHKKISQHGKDHIFSYQLRIKEPWLAQESTVEYTDDLYKIAKSIFIEVSQDNINETKGLINWTKQFFASNKDGFWYYVFAGIGVAKIISFLFK